MSQPGNKPFDCSHQRRVDPFQLALERLRRKISADQAGNELVGRHARHALGDTLELRTQLLKGRDGFLTDRALLSGGSDRAGHLLHLL